MAAAAAASGEAPSNRNARLCTFLKFLALALVLGAIIGLVCARAVVRHSSFKKVDIAVGVESALLTRFALNGNNSLDYTLVLNLTWTNNGRLGVYYYDLQARAFYGGVGFGNTALPKFSQPGQNTSTVRAELRGRTQVAGGGVEEKFNREEEEGYYYIDVEVDVKMWTKKYKNRKTGLEAEVYFAEVDCSLKVAPVSNGAVANKFERTGCDVKY